MRFTVDNRKKKVIQTFTWLTDETRFVTLLPTSVCTRDTGIPRNNISLFCLFTNVDTIHDFYSCHLSIFLFWSGLPSGSFSRGTYLLRTWLWLHTSFLLVLKRLSFRPSVWDLTLLVLYELLDVVVVISSCLPFLLPLVLILLSMCTLNTWCNSWARNRRITGISLVDSSPHRSRLSVKFYDEVNVTPRTWYPHTYHIVPHCHLHFF